MVPYVASPDQVLSQPSILESHIEKMRANALPSIFDTAESADVNGVAAENLIQATRILGDSTSNAAATTIFEKLGTLVVGSDVSHFRVPQPGAHPMLSDYLAYSAAALADYENLGRVNSLLEGQRVLQRAFQIFPAASFPGLLCTSGDTPLRDKFANSSSPQLADDVGESCTSLIIRLGHDYGNLLQNSSDHKLARLAKSWLQISLRLSQSVISTAHQLGPNAGGIYNARALIQDGRFAITVGKNPTSMAQSVVQQSPLFLVAPAIGPV
ncbi:MAG: hypothetical protein ACRDF4_02755, partial [Rhabdochlamydiaceae bacterium]